MEVREKTPTVKIEANDDPLGRGAYSWEVTTVEVIYRAPQQQAETSRVEEGGGGGASFHNNSGKPEGGEVVERRMRAIDNGSDLEEGKVVETISTADNDIPDFKKDEDEVRLVGMDSAHL